MSLLSRRLEQESKEAALSDQGIEDMTELGNLAFEYILYRNARAERQWRVKYGRISEQLAQDVYEYPEERALVGGIREDFEAAGRLFSSIVELRGQPGSGASPLARQREALLINGYLSRSLSVAARSFELSRMIREGERRSHERFHLLILIATAVIAVGTLAIAFVLGRSVSGPIARLQEGTEIIGAGDLDFRVGTDAGNEIGQLSRAFDRMTGNLKRITASRDELEREVAAREAAEAKQRALAQDLDRTNKELEKRLAEIKTLRGMLPICSYCKKIRDDQGYWQHLETYLSDHSDAVFSHGMCPACAERVMKEFQDFKKGRQEHVL